MQVISQLCGNALEAAFVRISHLPLPITGISSVSLECGYHDAYGDNPYVDCPYDDYQDNQPDPDE